MRHITDPEFRDLIPPLSESEYKALEQDLVKNGNRDPIVVWPYQDQKILLDGHHRYEICHRLKIRMRPAVDVQCQDREEAKLWILNNQFARRNLNRLTRAYLIGRQYNAEAPGQGARTDLRGRGTPRVGQRLAVKFHTNEETVRQYGLFAAAVDALTSTIGLEAKVAILHMEAPFNMEEIRQIAGMPADEHREVWTMALNDRSSLKRILQEHRRTKQSARASHTATPPTTGHRMTPSMTPTYDLADLVRLIAMDWGIPRIENYRPSHAQRAALEANLGNALHSLIYLSMATKWGADVLDHYVETCQAADAEKDKTLRRTK